MPELPEVETIKRIIEPQIKGQKILGLDICNKQVVAYPESEVFVEELIGRTITGMSRKGKYLSFELDNDSSLVLHLRMTGQLLVTPADYPIEKHTHLFMDLEDGAQMRYIDVRRFGRFWCLRKDECDTLTGREKLGVEPFDESLTVDYLKEKLGKKKKAIKGALHDQSIIAGIGNIYSDEILYEAKIYPEKLCMELNDDEWERLIVTVPKIIQWAITANHMTAEEYLAGQGKDYRNTPYLKAYGHAGEPCPRCGELMQKLVIGGRSSVFCPNCQKK